jgi:hypothetical protein
MNEWKNIGRIPPSAELENIIYIIISDRTLLNCLVGLEQINPRNLNDKLENFDKLLRLMNRDFHGKLLNLFPVEEKTYEPIVKAPIIEESMAKGVIQSKLKFAPQTPTQTPTSNQLQTQPQAPQQIRIQSQSSQAAPNSRQTYIELLRKLNSYNDTIIRICCGA